VSYRWHFIALTLALLHHADHITRGTHVGWPVTPAVTPFTYSLLIYPIVLLGFVVRSAWYWLAAVLGGLVMLTAVHVLIETPGEILGGYAEPGAGVVAFAILVALIAVLAYLAWRYAVVVSATRGEAGRSR
jgi:hypothetical protein